jgi:hypothetical protein
MFKTCLKPFLIICFLLFFTIKYKSYAQPKPVEMPYMYVPTAKSDKAQSTFRWAKWGELKWRLKNNNLPATVRIPNFIGFLEYLDTHFTTMNQLRVFLGVDPVKKNWLLIFSPMNGDINSLAYYRSDQLFDANNPVTIDSTEKNFLHNEWKKNMPRIGISNDTDNISRNRADDQTQTDTRYITYCKDDLKELLTVINAYEKKYSIGTDGIAQLAAFDAGGKDYGASDQQGHFKMRTFVLFGLTKKDGSEFSLEKIHDLHVNPLKYSNCVYSTDNGQLCPYYCPAP